MNAGQQISPETVSFQKFFPEIDGYVRHLLDGGHVTVTCENTTFAVIDYNAHTLTNRGFKAASETSSFSRLPTDRLRKFLVDSVPKILGKPHFLPLISPGGSEICVLDCAFVPQALGKIELPKPEPLPLAPQIHAFAAAGAAANIPASGPVSSSDASPELTPADLAAALQRKLNANFGHSRIPFSMGGRHFVGLVEPTERRFTGLNAFTGREIQLNASPSFETALENSIQKLASGHSLHVKNARTKVGVNNNIVIILNEDMSRAQGKTQSSLPRLREHASSSPLSGLSKIEDKEPEKNFDNEYMLAHELVGLSQSQNDRIMRFTLHEKSYVAVSTGVSFSENPEMIYEVAEFSRPMRALQLSDTLEKKMILVDDNKGILICVSEEKGGRNLFIIQDNAALLGQLTLAIDLARPSRSSTSKRRLTDHSFLVRRNPT